MTESKKKTFKTIGVLLIVAGILAVAIFARIYSMAKADYAESGLRYTVNGNIYNLVDTYESSKKMKTGVAAMVIGGATAVSGIVMVVIARKDSGNSETVVTESQAE